VHAVLFAFAGIAAAQSTTDACIAAACIEFAHGLKTSAPKAKSKAKSRAIPKRPRKQPRFMIAVRVRWNALRTDGGLHAAASKFATDFPLTYFASMRNTEGSGVAGRLRANLFAMGATGGWLGAGHVPNTRTFSSKVGRGCNSGERKVFSCAHERQEFQRLHRRVLENDLDRCNPKPDSPGPRGR